MRLSGSGKANISGSEKERSKCVANPPKPAPVFCISPIARDGTSFALCTPKRSTNVTRKYLIFFCFAIFSKLFTIERIMRSIDDYSIGKCLLIFEQKTHIGYN